MTIETRTEIASSAKAQGFRYVQSDDIALVSVISVRSESSTPLRDVLQVCAMKFQPYLRAWLRALPGARLFLFVATPPSDNHNALTRRRGVWGIDDLRWLPATAQRSPNVEVAVHQGGTRFVGFTAIPEESFFEAGDFARTHGASFLLVSSRDALLESEMKTITERVFSIGQSALDWTNVVSLADERDCICIRPSGGFDDREAVIDAFLRNELRRQLGEADTGAP
jgi:hypothetical protein